MSCVVSRSTQPMSMVSENQRKLNFNPVQLPHMAAKVNTVTGTKIKLIVKKASENNSRRNVVKDTVDHGKRDEITNRGSKHSEGNVLMKESIPLNSRKRKPEVLVVGQRAKKRKIDCSLKLHLRKILKELLNHHDGWVFSEPVDPVKLRIPDYFSIITKPMDLGTVLRKLEGNMYSGVDEFVADVRLTFSNAMLYNPPWHDVNRWAKNLDTLFSKKLESLEAKLKLAEKNDGEARVMDFMQNNGQDTKHTEGKNDRYTKPIGLNKAPLHFKPGNCRLMSLEEKQKFKLELVQSRQMIQKLWTVFQKFGLTGLSEERLDSYIDSTDDETLWKLRREVKAVLSAKDEKAQPGKIGLKVCSSLNKVEKAKQGRSLDSTESGSSCVSLKSHRLRTGAAQGSASDRSSERSEKQNHCADSKLEHKVECPSESRTSGCGLESDGPVVVNEEDSSHLTTPTSIEGCLTFNVPLSPKALRAAKLRSRFADTIFKATHQELQDQSKKSDPSRMQQERERLEREKQKEKDKIAAQIKAAETASRRREQNGLKMRMRERNAARMALDKLEKSVEFEGNVGVLDGLKMMGCGYLYYPCYAFQHGNRLQQLGLFCKDDFLQDDEDAMLNIEEGEIIS